MTRKKRIKELRRKFQRLVSRYFVYFFMYVIRTLPEQTLYEITRGLAKLGFFLARRYRNLTVSNLTHALGNEKSSEEINALAKKVFFEFAWGGVETALLLLKGEDTKNRLLRETEVEGAEYLDEALKQKKGIVCVSAHFGNFTLMPLRLSLMGYPCNMIVRDPKDPVVSKIFGDLRDEAGMRWIPLQPRMKSVAQSLRWLKKGGMLFLYADQFRSRGVFVDFFNRPAGVVEGPAVLHLRTGAEIVCAFSLRISREKHKIIITPPIKVDKTGNREEDIYQVTKAFTKTIEDYVRQYPDHWWWVHNRWKGPT